VGAEASRLTARATEVAPDVESRVKEHRVRAFARRSWWRIRSFPSRYRPRSRYFHRTAAYPSELAALVRWGALWLLTVVGLLGFAALVGRGAAHIHAGVLVDSVVKTVTSPAVAVPIAFLIAALCGCVCRAARLAWLAWRPGPIVVSDFQVPMPVTGTTPVEVTARFRDSLSLLRLDSAVPSPGATPEASFLDVLSSGGVSSSDILRTLLTLLRASWPTHAFAVEGLIQQRDEPKGCGIAVHAVRLPGEPAGLVEVWEADWEKAAQSAADGAVAALLPRTRYCRGPWAAWQGFRAPRELFTAYREAASLVGERRYDEALGCYREALSRDPTNLTIALQLGQLQEKIGLFIGALTTYQRILALDNPGAEPIPRGLYRRAARREWERSVRLARYRQIVLLGQGTLVREWCGVFPGDPENYRQRLRDHFREELEPLTFPRNDPVADAISDAIVELIEVTTSGDDEKVAKVQQALMPAVYQAAYELQRSLSRLELRPWQQPLSRRTVGLTLASQRTRARLADAGAREPDRSRHLPKQLDRDARWAGWRPGLWAGWRPPLLRRWTWQQQYNAACLYAIPLALELDAKAAGAARRPASAWKLDPTTANALARRAVSRLERAAARADSEFVATRRDWVLKEDPDLRGLRDRPEFKTFVDDYFPTRENPADLIFGETAGPAVCLPLARRSRARTVQTEYTHHLLGAVAGRWHELWHQRASQETIVDPHTLLRWWSEESDIWSLFGEVATQRYDWLRRQRLLQKANEICVGDGVIPIVASYGGFHTVSSSARGEPAGTTGERSAEACLAPLERWFALDDSGLARSHGVQLARCLELLRRADADTRTLGSRERLARLCHHQAALWQTLAEWLSGEITDEAETRERLHRQLSRTKAGWGRVDRLSRARMRLRRARMP
jgi:tetratricopeptide (TPR) repeat protein